MSHYTTKLDKGVMTERKTIHYENFSVFVSVISRNNYYTSIKKHDLPGTIASATP